VKILIFSHVSTWPSHHAEAIEIALNETKNGNEVIFVSCKGDLVTCPANPEHRELICMMCRNQSKKTKSIINSDLITFVDLNIYPETLEYKFNDLEQLKSFETNDFPIGRMVYSTLTTNLNDSFFSVKIHEVTLNTLINNGIGLYKSIQKLILDEKIELLYAWNGRRSCDGPAVYAAKNLNIGYKTFISGGKYNSILIREGSETVHDVKEAVMEMNAISKDYKNSKKKYEITKGAINYFDFASGGKKDENVNYLGYYTYSQLFKDDKTAINSNNKKILGIFIGTYSEYAGVPGFDSDNNYCKDFYEGIDFFHNNSHRLKNYEIIIRWHPNSRYLNGNEKEKLEKLILNSKKYNNVKHISPDSDFNTYNLIKNCYVAIGFGTSVTIEACLHGKPSIFVGNNLFEGLDCFYKPESYSELLELLENELSPKSFNDALVWGYYFQNFGNLDFKHLDQKLSNIFYLDNKRVISNLLFLKLKLGKVKRSIKKTISN